MTFRKTNESLKYNYRPYADGMFIIERWDEENLKSSLTVCE